MAFSTRTAFRTHTCDELRVSNVGDIVTLCGFVHRIRDHGGLLFIDLRDHYGMTQCVLQETGEAFKIAENLKDETVVAITGKVVKRSEDTKNPNMTTGEIELYIDKIDILSAPETQLPLQINVENEFPEDTRLTYRYLDLRKKENHDNIILRSRIISHIRNEMTNRGFLEIQTPILTSSSPEGARDYLVPSRIHHGKFYALPQAPQQFKQLLMVAGFDRYFQIAPCFRDEDARADRSPGEFYQLDMEMSFASQEDVFEAIEPVLHSTFTRFAPEGYTVTSYPFPRITFDDAMLHYGCDKPDMRNPLIIEDLTEVFRNSGFGAFANEIANGAKVRSINVPGCTKEPRSFFDKLNDWAKEL
ncbi:MAG: aspartate--tRNA ligase, partial [Alphaproteobacteria bacterium]|nr:aspartate--tRNA ligase [Alphaproteobacteria bacterium]